MEQPHRDNPVWETIVIGVSFLVLWAWMLARQAG
jgi:hypothetical protein